MAQRRWHFRRWTIWLLLKKTTWSSGSYKKYELLNHFVCNKDKAHFLQYHTWTVLWPVLLHVVKKTSFSALNLLPRSIITLKLHGLFSQTNFCSWIFTWFLELIAYPLLCIAKTQIATLAWTSVHLIYPVAIHPYLVVRFPDCIRFAVKTMTLISRQQKWKPLLQHAVIQMTSLEGEGNEHRINHGLKFTSHATYNTVICHHLPSRKTGCR